MKVLVTARDSGVSNGDKAYAEEKAEKLTRFFNGIQKTEMILGPEGQLVRAEIVLSIANADQIVAHVDHERARTAIDLAVDKAEKAVRRHKEKVRDHRPSGSKPEAPSEYPEEKLDSYQDVVDQTEFPK